MGSTAAECGNVQLAPTCKRTARHDRGPPQRGFDPSRNDLTAVAADEPWLPIAIGGLAPQWAIELEPAAAVRLQAVAEYRQRWSVTSTQPLGVTPAASDQLAEHEQLRRLLAPTPQMPVTRDAKSVSHGLDLQ